MADLSRQEIFSSGTWNGTQFTDADLDSMVASFDALGLTGRVPLKFGHDSPKPDGQPALGWVSRVWRDGSKLLADFANVPEKVLSLIRDKAYKFVSVELLKNVRAGTRSVPWVLDAVALLGADQPAVGILRELTMSARSGLRFDARVAFTRESTLMKSGDDTMSEVETLRAELARVRQNAALGIVQNAVDSGRCLPRELHAFKRRYSDPSMWTPELAAEWVQLTELAPHQRAKYSTRATRVEPSDEQRLPDDDTDAIGDAYRAAAKRLGISDPYNASANDQYRVWRATRQAAPEVYASYVASSGAV